MFKGYTLDNDLMMSISTEVQSGTVNEIELKLYYIPFIHGKFYRNVEEYELRNKR